jgi:Raf kinase inhibitor-like YbhB/YbcL family protein
MNLERPRAEDPYKKLPTVGTFSLTSTDVADCVPMNIRHSSDGGDLSPQLAWRGFPLGTRSFAVSCFDPDAPTPSGFWHWTWLNLPINMTELPTGFATPDAQVPAGVIKATNDGGTLGFVGAAPPPGDMFHRYYFAIHALDVEYLDLPQGIGCTPASFNIGFHTLARAVIAPTYRR